MSALVPSQRSTTSSRLPGKALEGTVWKQKRQVHACPKCHRLTFASTETGHVHSPQYRDIGGQHVLVDCTGDVVEGA